MIDTDDRWRESQADRASMADKDRVREAEQALLGAVLFENEAYHRVSDTVVAEDFFDPIHAAIFEAITGLISTGRLAEPLAVLGAMKGYTAFAEGGGLRFVAELVDKAPPHALAADYARMVKEASIRRGVASIGAEAVQRANLDNSDPASIISETEAALYALAERGRTSKGIRHLSEAFDEAVALAAAAYENQGLAGEATGFLDLDKKLGGLFPTDLIILAARPSMGKTALATNIAFNVARRLLGDERPGTVAFFSLEMQGVQLALRMLAEHTGVSSNLVRRGEITPMEFGQIRDGRDDLRNVPFWYDDTAGLNVSKIAATCRRLKRTHGLSLIVIDYLQLCTAPFGPRRNTSRAEDVSAITAALKTMAKELEIPVLALSQLSRTVENREDKRPQLSDLRESGSIEQDADVVLFLYRKAYYAARDEPDTGTPEHLAWQEEMDKIRNLAEVIVAKQRHGPIGSLNLSFDERITKFGNMARESRGIDFAAARHPYAGGLD